MSVAEKLRKMKEQQAAASAKVEKTPTPTTTKEECPHCGRSFVNLSKHINKCKDNPDNETPTKSVSSQPSFDPTTFMESFKPFVESMIESKINELPTKPTDQPSFDPTTFMESFKPFVESMIESRVGEPRDDGKIIEQVVSIVTGMMNDRITERDDESPTIPSELVMMVDNIARSWEELREPAERRWAQSSGYLKIVNRLTEDIETIKRCIKEE